MLGVNASSTQLTALNNHSRAGYQLGRTTERLATGLRINSGKDDPAGLIAAEKLRGDLVEIGARKRSLQSERAQNSVYQSGLRQASSILNDLRGKVVEAASVTSSPSQKQAIQIQINSSLDALDYVSELTGVEVPNELLALRSGESANVVDGDATAAAEIIDEQASNLAFEAAAAGTYERYTLDVEQRLAEDQEVVTAQSLSEIADADFAEEASNLARDSILYRVSLQTVGLVDKLRGEFINTLLG